MTADMRVTAEITSIKDDEAQKKLKENVKKIFQDVKITSDTSLLEKELKEAFRRAGATGAIIIRDLINKEMQKQVFKFGNSTGGGKISKFSTSYNSQEGIRSGLSPSGKNGGMILKANEKFVDELVKVAEEAGATKRALKGIRENFIRQLSGFEVGADGAWKAGLNLGKGGKLSLSGGSRKDEDGREITLQNFAADKGYSSTDYGKTGYNTSVQATKELKEQTKLLNLLLARQQELNKASREYWEIEKSCRKVKKEIAKLETQQRAVNKTGTEAQKQNFKNAQKLAKIKEQEREEAQKIKEQEKERNNHYSKAKNLQKEMNALIKQNIEYGDKANGEQIVEENNKKLEVLKQEYEVEKGLVSLEQKEKLQQQEQTDELKQQLLQQEKIYKLRSTRNTKGSFIDEVETAFGRVTTYGVAYNIVNAFKNKLKETINIIVNFDKSMNNLRIVTQQDSVEVKRLAQNYINLAQSLGTTTDKVFEAADLWLRQGRTIAETNNLIEATMVMANVAQIESSKAADILTSAINGFKMEAKDAMHVVDVFAAVDLAAAANTEELAEAMQRVAATAGEVGVSFENITSYIATLVDATRLDSGTIGSALNTILSRMQNIKLGNLVGEEETLSDTQKALAQVGIQLFDVNGSFRNMDEVLGDIASKWSTLNDVEKSSIAYAVAGMEYLYAGYVLEYMVTYSHLRYQKAKMA